MSMFNPNETQQAHEARKNAAIASPTSPNADRSGYAGTHIGASPIAGLENPASTYQAPAIVAPTASQAPLPIGLGAPQQEEPRPIGF